MILTLWLTDTTLNVMSLMGVVMLVGIAVSNSILIVEFTRHLRSEGMGVREAVAMACRVRLRPVLMTSLATIIGLLPMALKLGAGSEAYAPLARAILGGLERVGGADRVSGAGGVCAGLWRGASMSHACVPVVASRSAWRCGLRRSRRCI